MEDKISLLVADILAKKELSNLEPPFVIEKLNPYLKNNKKVRQKFEGTDFSKFRKSKEHEQVVKAIRAQLRSIYGVFIMEGYKKRHPMLDELKDDPSIENHERILALHKSSQERLTIYPMLYSKLFEITGKPKKILDLACGLNPVSYIFLGCKPEYTACDLSEKDLEFIDTYFEVMKIKGKTQRLDLIKDIDRAAELSKGVDVTFLFKALDSLEAIKWNISHELMQKLNSKFIIVSFATRSIGGKKEIRKAKRAWFEKMLKGKNWEYTEIEMPGESFYIVKKS